MDRLRVESYLLEVIAGRMKMTLEEYLVDLGRRELKRMEREAPGVFDELLTDLGRQVYKGGFGEAAPDSAPKPAKRLHKKKCSKCGAMKGYRAFALDSTECRKCVEKAGKAAPVRSPPDPEPEVLETPPDPEPEVLETSPALAGTAVLKECARCGVRKLPNGFYPQGEGGDICISCHGRKPGEVFLCKKCKKMKQRAGFRFGVCKACRTAFDLVESG